jgi:hypothetical protein
LPRGWEDRVVQLPDPADDEAEVWSPEAHDLAVSKLVAHRQKDYEYVRALLRDGKLSLATLKERAADLVLAPNAITAVMRWLDAQER